MKRQRTKLHWWRKREREGEGGRERGREEGNERKE